MTNAFNEEVVNKCANDDMSVCTMCQCNYNTKKDAFNWIPGGMPCCKQSVHLTCFSKWRFDNYTVDRIYVTKCHVCRTYVPAVWFFGQVYIAVENYVKRLVENYVKCLENISTSNNQEGCVVLDELRDQAPVYFTFNRREPYVSMQTFLRSEKVKLKKLTIKSEETEKRINGFDVFENDYMNARQNAFKGIPPLRVIERVEERGRGRNNNVICTTAAKGLNTAFNVCKKGKESLFSIIIYTCNLLL